MAKIIDGGNYIIVERSNQVFHHQKGSKEFKINNGVIEIFSADYHIKNPTIHQIKVIDIEEPVFADEAELLTKLRAFFFRVSNRILITAECNGPLKNNNYQWGFGANVLDGNSGVILPRNGFIEQLTLNVASIGNQTTNVSVELNGTGVGSISLAPNTSSNLVVFAPAIPFQAGQRLNFRTVSNGKTANGVVNALVYLV